MKAIIRHIIGGKECELVPIEDYQMLERELIQKCAKVLELEEELRVVKKALRRTGEQAQGNVLGFGSDD